jgi:Uma2 family endonuclease
MKTAPQATANDDRHLAYPIVLTFPKPLDADTLFWLSDHHNLKFEQTAQGELIISPPTGSAASLGESSLHGQVAAWRDAHAPNDIVLPATGGITLPDGSEWGPDSTWIKAETYARASDKDIALTYWRLIPDGVFELLSPSDRVGDIEYNLKMGAYLANKLPLIVVLDPKERRTLTSRDGGPFVESRELKLDLNSHMPGFVLDVKAVFDSEAKLRRLRGQT